MKNGDAMLVRMKSLAQLNQEGWIITPFSIGKENKIFHRYNSMIGEKLVWGSISNCVKYYEHIKINGRIYWNDFYIPLREQLPSDLFEI